MDFPLHIISHLIITITEMEVSATLCPLSLSKANYKSISAQVQESTASPRKTKRRKTREQLPDVVHNHSLGKATETPRTAIRATLDTNRKRGIVPTQGMLVFLQLFTHQENFFKK